MKFEIVIDGWDEITDPREACETLLMIIRRQDVDALSMDVTMQDGAKHEVLNARNTDKPDTGA